MIDPALIDLLRRRRDVRRFRTTPLPPGLLAELVAAADLAPSVGLSQPWRLVEVASPEPRQAIRAVFERCNRDALADQGARAGRYARLKLAGLDAAPCQLAVFVDDATPQGHGLGRRTMPETLGYSAVLAIHTLWLAARSAGVGLGWVSILDPGAVATILAVPATWRLIGYLCLGYAEADGDVPELEAEGWEVRRPATLLRR